MRILLVEDDRALRTGLTDSLALEGYDVTAVGDGDAARAAVLGRHFDLVILDLMLPRRGGLEVLKEMRGRRLATPVLILTAKGDESDKVIGLELGADDYVTKPFGLRELLARVKAMLRRTGKAKPLERFAVGDAQVDLATFQVRRARATFTLSRKEAAMLELLVSAGGRAVPRARFLEEVWGGDSCVGDRTIDTHVLNLRKKLERDPKAPKHLLTVYGIGYRLVLDLTGS
jgi:DNA-binding response OmpR family regulator